MYNRTPGSRYNETKYVRTQRIQYSFKINWIRNIFIPWMLNTVRSQSFSLCETATKERRFPHNQRTNQLTTTQFWPIRDKFVSVVVHHQSFPDVPLSEAVAKFTQSIILVTTLHVPQTLVEGRCPACASILQVKPLTKSYQSLDKPNNFRVRSCSFEYQESVLNSMQNLLPDFAEQNATEERFHIPAGS